MLENFTENMSQTHDMSREKSKEYFSSRGSGDYRIRKSVGREQTIRYWNATQGG